MAAFMELDTKAAICFQSKVCDSNNIYVPKPKAMDL